MKPAFTPLDFGIVVAYLLGTTALGVWVGRRQRDAADYFVASRQIPWWAVLFSVVATETSALTFISIPALAYSRNIVFLQFTLFLLIGVGLYAFYRGRAFAQVDEVFPTFVIEQMPQGLVGLIVAAIIAATMSTHSGAINSLAAATTHDIYLPLTGRQANDPRTLRVGKLFALVWGVGLTLGALLFKQQGTPVVIVALAIASFTYGALLGGFFLGLFWPRARQRDAILGMSVGILVMALVVFAKPIAAACPALAHALSPSASIAWPWYVLIGTSITVLVGGLSSFVPLRPFTRT